MDFIFGTLATDELKVVHHRTRQRGIQHDHQIEPLDPLPGDPIRLTVHIGADLNVNQVACYYTLDGSLPDGRRGTASNGQAALLQQSGVHWDTIAWQYVAEWQLTLPPQPEGTIIRYRISAWGEQDEYFADYPDVIATAEAAATAFFRKLPVPHDIRIGSPQPGQHFTLHVDRLQAPQWAREAIIYHVFVDRFCPGGDKEWLQTSDLKGFCGGTLWGVQQKLDHIEELGANCLWLSPTWPAPSHHGYDVTDHDHVEPRLGGDEAMHALVEAAHARGIRVLLDLVCNHISNDHPIFQAALHDPNSCYRDWFTFDESELGYKSFFGVRTMPQVNYQNMDARRWMLDISRYWIREFDVDGYRLDYANGPGPDFWADFWAACKAEKADSYCFGEIVDAPDALRNYIGRLDGCLDFPIGEALRKTYGWHTWTESELDAFIERHYTYFPENFVMPTFLDNHDMDRFIYIAGGNIEALKKAAAVQMRLPGPPIIYYGTEVGLSQVDSTKGTMGLHVSRTPMLWGNAQNVDLFDYYKQLIQQRKARTL